MTRLSDWQSRLSAYIVANAQRPFRYGEFDCGLFVADAIEAMTGIDVAAELRGQYATRRQAFAAIRSVAGRATVAAIADCLAARYGCQEVAVAFAQRGDAVQLGRGRASRLGIVTMHGTELLTPYQNGLLRLSMTCAVRAWRIG